MPPRRRNTKRSVRRRPRTRKYTRRRRGVTRTPLNAVKRFRFTVSAQYVVNSVQTASSGASLLLNPGGIRCLVPPVGSAGFGTNSDTSYFCIAWLHTAGDIQGISAFTAMFDRYKITGVQAKIASNFNTNMAFGPVLGSGGPSTSAPQVTINRFVDTNDVTTFPATDTEWNRNISWARSRQTAWPIRRDIKQFYKVRQLVPTYSSTGGNYFMTMPSQWIDNMGTSVIYAGQRLMIQIVNTTPDAVSFDLPVSFRYYLAYKEFTGLS